MPRKLLDLGYIGQPIVVLDICEDNSMPDVVTISNGTECIKLRAGDVYQMASKILEEFTSNKLKQAQNKQ